MTIGRVLGAVLIGTGVAVGAAAAMIAWNSNAGGVDHEKHRGLFPACTSCHGGVADSTLSLWPDPASCVTCHDGEAEDSVSWDPPTELPATNLRFDHDTHAGALTPELRDGTSCVDCHSSADAPWLSVRLTVVAQCIDCHEIEAEHLAAPDSACTTCHVPLTDASRLSNDAVAAFEAPPSHEAADFGETGHGAVSASREGIAGSCATCHAREFCLVCHVDAPEQEVIQALGSDSRSLLHDATLAAPASHDDSGFVVEHGVTVEETPARCATCHTRESCLACHAPVTEVGLSVHPAGPGRGVGAQVVRMPPRSHGVSFTDLHGTAASAASATCAGCHVRQECLDCHRPGAGDASPAYHPGDFLARHPTAAFTRETSCSDCHNVRAFCAACHQQAGIVAARPLGSGYHDAKRFFVAGHGQAARQSLETCVSCHTERDCLSCHSALGGRRFNPHGPGFDADRLRSRTPQTCTVCHGLAIPEGR